MENEASECNQLVTLFGGNSLQPFSVKNTRTMIVPAGEASECNQLVTLFGGNSLQPFSVNVVGPLAIGQRQGLVVPALAETL
jgi:hypothetical protein